MNIRKKALITLLVFSLVILGTSTSYAFHSWLRMDDESFLLELQNPSGNFRAEFIDFLSGRNRPFSEYSPASRALNRALDGDLEPFNRYGISLEDLKDENGQYLPESMRNQIIAEAIVNTAIEKREAETVDFLCRTNGFSIEEARKYFDLAIESSPRIKDGDTQFIDFVLIRRLPSYNHYYAFDVDTRTVLAFTNYSFHVDRGVYYGDLTEQFEMKFNSNGKRWSEQMKSYTGNVMALKTYGIVQEYLEGSAKEAERILQKAGFDLAELFAPQKEYIAITVGCNIRDNPSYDAKSIQWANVGDYYELLGQNGAWYKIALPNGSVGYTPKDRGVLSN